MSQMLSSGIHSGVKLETSLISLRRPGNQQEAIETCFLPTAAGGYPGPPAPAGNQQEMNQIKPTN